MWRYGRCVASQSALGWGLSLCGVAGRCLGESVRAWLGTVTMWRVSPRLIGDYRYVASQSALGWGLSLCGVAAAAWRVSPRLVGDCRYVASQSALDWGLSLCGESVRSWLGTVAMWRCGRCVASQSALGWGDSLLSVAGRCLGDPRLVGDCRYVALPPLRGESVRAWLGTIAMWRCGPLCGESVRAWQARLSQRGGSLP
ncbi:hypothetical protein ACLB2K_012621 [Fragaria x ananassa]